MELNTLRDLLVEQLQDVYSAESQIIKALPKMVKAASNEQLKQAFAKHLSETQTQKEKLDKVFELMNVSPGRHKCKAMEGLVEESKEMIEQEGEPEVIDAGLIASAQRIEHYEIAAYGTARVYAKQLGEMKVEKILSEILQQEKDTDVALTELALSTVNIEAEGVEGEE